MARKPSKPKNTKIETITHDDETRPNIPTAEMENLVRDEEAKPVKVEYERKNNPDENPELYARNPDLDPQLVWKGKEEEDREPLSVDSVPIYVQERIHPKAIIDDIKRMAAKDKQDSGEETIDLFADWDGDLDPEDKIEFYEHAQKWTNRMILGDSLQVMTSLSEKEGFNGQVQCIYFDPPYGINFGSNWQPSSKSNKSSANEVSKEPEQIKAFRDTWSKGLSSYLSYLRDRLTVSRNLLNESGSLFVQISTENMHIVRSLIDEVFGSDNFMGTIRFRKKTMPLGGSYLEEMADYILWVAKCRPAIKYRQLYIERDYSDDTVDWKFVETESFERYQLKKEEIVARKPLPEGARRYRLVSLWPTSFNQKGVFGFNFRGTEWWPSKGQCYPTTPEKMERLAKANLIEPKGNFLNMVLFDTFARYQKLTTNWNDTSGARDKSYVVETSPKVIERCILMTSDPGDIVLDPTCGSGTTPYVAEKFGRRWITIDTSRVAITLARQRLVGSNFEYFKLADENKAGNPSQGFVYATIPSVTQKTVANNSLIDEIWDKYQKTINQALANLNETLGTEFNEWEVPHSPGDSWPAEAIEYFETLVSNRKARQNEINNAVLNAQDGDLLYDQPLINNGIVRVTGPFTVESLSPHRVVPTDADDEALLASLDDEARDAGEDVPERQSKRLRPKSEEEGEDKFIDIIYENLRKAGVQNTKKGERMEFTSLDPWANGRYVQFEGRYMENGKERKAAICVGPEYGTVTKSLMVHAAREAADYFDILVVLGFAFEAHADEELINIGKMQVLRARMNNDLHMADRLKSGKSGNLFVVFGEPDIELRETDDGKCEVEIKGVDIFDPTTGDVRASGPDDIACWFVDTDYNDEAFFVRHAYFSGGGPDPFKRLKTTLKAEINEEAWSSLYSTVSRPFDKPTSGRIAVKAINHFGDEVLKVFSVN